MLNKAQNLRNLTLGIVPSKHETVTSTDSSLDDVSKPVEVFSYSQSASTNSPNSLLSLAALLRMACPQLTSLHCLSPLASRQGKGPYTEFYEAVCANWLVGQGRWEVVQRVNPVDRVFGMTTSA